MMGLQDRFLNAARKQGVSVTIHTINGFQLNSAVILGFDSFVVFAEVKGKQMMLYKHAISTITPDKRLDFDIKGKDDKDE